MAIDETIPTEGQGPQWLGSLVRRGEKPATAASEPVFDDEGATQWLGSVARRNAETPEDASAWTGSAGRAAIFNSPPPQPPSDEIVTAADATVHELGGRERIVMGALGMTLRVAA
jgi:hypothetical protein